MIGRSARRQPLDPAEAKIGKIKLVNKDIDHPNRIVFTDILIKPFGK